MTPLARIGLRIVCLLVLAVGSVWADGTGEIAVEDEVAISATSGKWGLGVEDDAVGGSTQGEITLEGGKLVAGSIGDIEWERSGTSLFGTLRSKEGSDVAYFTATLGGDGPLTGTFTTVGGEDGTWAWDGPIPSP
jgi:hypothetical protein